MDSSKTLLAVNPCCTPPVNVSNYIRKDLGVDQTNNGWGEVFIDECKTCNCKWLHYFYEHPLYDHSGRWFRGIITANSLMTLTAENALAILASMPWYFYGGSYYNGKTAIGNGLIRL